MGRVELQGAMAVETSAAAVTGLSPKLGCRIPWGYGSTEYGECWPLSRSGLIIGGSMLWAGLTRWWKRCRLAFPQLGTTASHNPLPLATLLQLHKRFATAYNFSVLPAMVSAVHRRSKMAFKADEGRVCNQLTTQAKKSKMPSVLGQSGRVLR
jgi:hypothetical protein